MTISTGRLARFIAELRLEMTGKVVSRGDKSYEGARQIWSGVVDNHPALIAICDSVADVQAAVRAARRYGLPLSVLGGGYDWAGRSMRQDELVIDLSAMNAVEIDAQAQVAKVEGGVTGAVLAVAAGPYELTAVAGASGKIGMAGFTLAGGYGPLSPKFGLGVDNLIGAQVVLADGRCVTASLHQNAELFWAIRGGGGNFGVVTAMEIRLHPMREVLAGKLMFPWSDARSVLDGYARVMACAPDELALTVALVSSPDGNPAIVLSPCWTGDLQQGLDVIAGLRRLGSVSMDTVGAMPPSALFDLFEPSAPPGQHYAQQTRWLAELGSGTIGDLIELADSKTSPLSMLALQSFHGVPSRVPLVSSAFGLRQKHFLVSIVAGWNGSADDDGSEHRQWARDASATLARCALPGGYPNLLGPDERVQAEAAYGRNTPRLLAEKQRFDPENVFRTTPLPTAAHSMEMPKMI